MTESDHDYFERRAAEERAAAAHADNAIAQRRHLELAQRYEEVASMSGGQVLEVMRRA